MKASRETIREESRTAPDIGSERADPVSIEGDGDGAIMLSCEEADAIKEKIAAMERIIEALEVLVCAIAESGKERRENANRTSEDRLAAERDRELRMRYRGSRRGFM